MPPPPVRALAVFGAGTPARSSFARLSSPPSSTSTSRTTTPLFLPVGTPTLAEGHRFHHCSITRGSVVASQWPLRVSGLLAPGSQGGGGRWRGKDETRRLATPRGSYAQGLAQGRLGQAALPHALSRLCRS